MWLSMVLAGEVCGSVYGPGWEVCGSVYGPGWEVYMADWEVVSGVCLWYWTGGVCALSYLDCPQIIFVALFLGFYLTTDMVAIPFMN